MFIFIFTVCGIIILISMLRTRHFIRSVILSAMQGLVSLFAVNLAGELTGVYLSLNWFSAAVGAVGGLPGIIFLLVSDIIVSVM